MGRRAASIAIPAWLLLQIAIPAAYYLGPPAADERFRWRMFSTAQYERQACTFTATERVATPEGGDQPRRIDLHRALSASSVRALGRHPLRVGEALLRARCAADPATLAAAVARVCHREGQGSVPAGEVSIHCGTGALSSSGF